MLIKPISYWQLQTPSVDIPLLPQNIYLCGFNFYQWKGTRLGTASSGGIAKISQTGTLDTTWTTNANPGTQQVRFFSPLNGNFYCDYRNTGGTGRTFRKLDSTGTSVASVNTSGGSIWGVNALEGSNFIMITGDTSTLINYGGTNIRGIGKLNESLTLDTTFATNIGTGCNNFCTGASISATRMAVTGLFSTFNGNSTYERFVVLNHDGTRDLNFVRTGTFNAQTNTAIFIDNKWIVAGNFTTYGGVTQNKIMAFNTSGSVDTAFTTNIGSGFNDNVSSLTRISNTQIVVGGSFTTLNGVTQNRIALLNTDGTIPTQPFGTGFTSAATSIGIDNADRYYVSSAPFVTGYQGFSSNNFFPINSDGSINSSFITGSAMLASNGTTVAEVGNLFVRT